MKNRIVGLGLLSMIFTGIMAFTAQATSLSFHATSDDQFIMYISTNPGVTGNQVTAGNNWEITYSGSIELTPGVTNYLQLYCLDTGGVASFIGDFTLNDAGFMFNNGVQFMVTNDNKDHWFVSQDAWYSGSNVLTEYGINGPGVEGLWTSYPNPNINPNAYWIWSDDYREDNVAYITTAITPIPLPPAALLLGSGLAGLMLLRRKRSL